MKRQLNPFEVVSQFEVALAEYTGATYAVAVDSCTNALLLSCAYHRVDSVCIPTHTYVGVPMSILHAGGRVTFRRVAWEGMYQLEPYPIYDAAKRLYRGMYVPETFMCLSFHWVKTLGIGRGGAILTDCADAVPWLKKARFDGRTEGVPPNRDVFDVLGWHMYMTPELAAAGLVRLSALPDVNADQPLDDYPDLSQFDWDQLRKDHATTHHRRIT